MKSCRQYRIVLVILFLVVNVSGVYSQTTKDNSDTTEVDVMDMLKKIFSKKTPDTVVKKPSTIALLPAIGYNPSMGFLLGVNMTGGKYFGNKDSTIMSVFSLVGYVTIKKIITAQFKHNIFTKNNRFNFQGNWQLSKMV